MAELRLYSDPDIVAEKAQQLGLNPVHPSSQARKKFMVFNGEKMIHFGQIPYEDYTKHGDKARRHRFRKRNHRWASAPKYSPSWLCWNLLWT